MTRHPGDYEPVSHPEAVEAVEAVELARRVRTAVLASLPREITGPM